MKKLTTTIKEAIKDRLEDITRIAKDYKNIIDHDYQFVDGYEENAFYFKFNKAIKSELVKIENILDDINHARNNIELGLNFIDWADVYFQDKFNMQINSDEAYDSFKYSLPVTERVDITKFRFIRKMKMWCEIRGYEYNPEDIMKQRTEIERKLNEIRFMKVTCDGEEICYGFYIGNKEENDNQTL